MALENHESPHIHPSHPIGLLCSREALEALESPPRPRMKGSPANYKFLLGKILFANHDSKHPYNAEIRNLPLHLVPLITRVFNSCDITLYYTIAPSKVEENYSPEQS